MRYKSTLKARFTVALVVALSASLSYAENPSTDLSTANLVAGFGTEAINQKLMNQAPTGNDITIPTDTAQATYLLSPSSPLVGPLTQQLLIQLANLDKDKDNTRLSFTWNPNTKPNPTLAKEPLKSVDINTLLQPMVYNDTQTAEANNVIAALSGALVPIDTVNFNQLIANLSGNKGTNLKAKLNEKEVQQYLAALRSYIAAQTVALGNLYQLYAERQIIDPSKETDPTIKDALEAIPKTQNPLSTLKLENFMATHRITDKNWHLGLLKDNPATLQRQQVELLAENLSESYQTRMTLERLLATMSVLVLEFNQQIRSQLETKIQSLNSPTQQ